MGVDIVPDDGDKGEEDDGKNDFEEGAEEAAPPQQEVLLGQRLELLHLINL